MDVIRRRAGRGSPGRHATRRPGRHRDVRDASCDRIPANVAAVPSQTHCGVARGRDRHGSLAQARARRGRPGDAGHRRGDRRRDLRRRSAGRGRANRARRRGDPRWRRTRPGPLVHPAGRLLRAGGSLLRRTGRDDSPGGQRLRLLVRDARRAGGLDHRLGPDSGVRRRQRRRGDFVGRLLQVPVRRLGFVACVAHHRLPHGAAQPEQGRPRASRHRSDDCGHSDSRQPARRSASSC